MRRTTIKRAVVVPCLVALALVPWSLHRAARNEERHAAERIDGARIGPLDRSLRLVEGQPDAAAAVERRGG